MCYQYIVHALTMHRHCYMYHTCAHVTESSVMADLHLNACVTVQLRLQLNLKLSQRFAGDGLLTSLCEENLFRQAQDLGRILGRVNNHTCAAPTLHTLDQQFLKGMLHLGRQPAQPHLQCNASLKMMVDMMPTTGFECSHATLCVV